jgi:PAS domain S-box-containing protein
MSVEAGAAQTRRRMPAADVPPVLQTPPEFLEKLPIVIYACDRNGRILWFNERAAELWGRRPRIGDDSEKYCGSYKLYFGGRPISREETPIAAVLRTGVPVRGAEGKVERPDGTSIWAVVHIEPVEDGNGNIAGAINCFHDISDRVNAAALLYEHDQRLTATYEHAGIGIAEIDGDGMLRRMNAHLSAMLGYPQEELLGRSIFDPDLAEEIEPDQTQFRRQVNGEIDSYTVEKRFRRSGGGNLWVSVTSSSVCDAEGRFLYAVRIQRDVTGQRVAEDERRRRPAGGTAVSCDRGVLR